MGKKQVARLLQGYPAFTSSAHYSDTVFIKKGKKWARLDSNQRPRNYEFPALTTAPRAR